MTNRRINHEVVKWMFARCQWWIVIDSQRGNRGGFLRWSFQLCVEWNFTANDTGNVLMRVNIYISGAVDHKSIRTASLGYQMSILEECETWATSCLVNFGDKLCSTRFCRFNRVGTQIYRFWSIVDFPLLLLIYTVTKQQIAYSDIHEIKQSRTALIAS